MGRLLISRANYRVTSARRRTTARVFNDLIDDFFKSDFKSFWDDLEIFKITLKYGDLIGDLILKMTMKIKSQIV
jgi:hypothetical protein